MFWKDDEEFKVLENQNKICAAMYDQEKNDVLRLHKEARKEIAKTTQLQMEDIADAISKYKQMHSFHAWLKGKEARKEPIPDSRDELMQMYRVERPAFLMK